VNIIEEYYEYMFEFKRKLNLIEKEFLLIDFKVTYKDEHRITVVRENTYIEFYQDIDKDKYMFSINHDGKNIRSFTNSFEKIENKIKEVKKIVGGKNATN